MLCELQTAPASPGNLLFGNFPRYVAMLTMERITLEDKAWQRKKLVSPTTGVKLTSSICSVCLQEKYIHDHFTHSS